MILNAYIVLIIMNNIERVLKLIEGHAMAL